MSNPRRHHYCPQFYLANFTETGKPDGRLWVTDKVSSQLRPSKPINEAHQRDFYYIEVDDGNDPYFLEREFSKIETGAGVAIEEVLRTRSFPKNDDSYSYLIGFIGLQAVRVPELRNKWSTFMSDVAKSVLDISSATKERFEASKARMLKEGRGVADLTYEEYREHIDGENFKIEMHQNHLLLQLLKMGGTLTDLLLKRNWTVAEAAEGAEFVSSDNPVGLIWIRDPGGFRSPGFGLPNTQVTFPISNKVALIGTYENGPAACELSPEGVAVFNNCAISGATRFIYSARGDFTWFASGNTIKNRDEFVKLHKEVIEEEKLGTD